MNEFIEFARELAEASGEIVSKYFRTSMLVCEKSDLSPVTVADRQAEQVMRHLIQSHYPDHDILGEEFEPVNHGAEYQWVLDPIDGTKTFVAGTVLFGTLIALLKNGRPILGVINNPITNQTLIGDGHRTWLNGMVVHVRDCSSIEDATLLTTSHWSVGKNRDEKAFEALTKRTKMYRTWGDCYGYYMVATGYADIMIDPTMHIWDVAPLIPIIEGAGGRITDYFGNDPMSAEGTVATTGRIHAEVIRALNSNSRWIR
jgi:histidinol phosphatase-like enzyme (inositol monophosphatase family)